MFFCVVPRRTARICRALSAVHVIAMFIYHRFFASKLFVQRSIVVNVPVLPVRDHISGTAFFTEFSAVARESLTAIFARSHSTLEALQCTSGFMDDVIFAYNEPQGPMEARVDTTVAASDAIASSRAS